MLLAFLLLCWLIKREDYVERYIYALASWMIICVVVVEGFSVFDAISTLNFRVAWLIIDTCLVAINLRRYKRREQRQKSKKFGTLERKHVLGVCFCCLILGIAFKTVPYNWDSMTYHLPRLIHWMENGSVDYYATHIDRQVSSPIGGAYINLIIMVMTGGSDLFLNMLQCGSYLANGMLVFSIAHKLEVKDKYCCLASLLFYSLPIAMSEAFSTQVDNFASLWMLSIICLLLDFLRNENTIELNCETTVRILVLSVCVAMGYLVKPSIGIGLLVFAVWLLFVSIKRKDSLSVVTIYIIMAAIVILLVLFPQFYRNYVTFGVLSPPNVGRRQLIGTLNPIEVFVNCIKNISFNLPATWIYGSRTIAYIIVIKVAELLNVDINNPTISEDGRDFVIHLPQTYSHDCAVNPIIVYLLFASIVFYIVKNRKKKNFEFKNYYFIASSVSFFLFCALLRWEAFVSRYMISYFALLCPAVMTQFELFFDEERLQKYRHAFGGVICFVCLSEMFGLFMYHGTIAISEKRNEAYFYHRSELIKPYLDISEYVKENNILEVGLLLDTDSYEYPLLLLLQDCNRVESVDVENATSKFEDDNFVPEILIVIEKDDIRNKYVYHGQRYNIVKKMESDICILKKE